jgi:replicative DNA helicase
LALEHLPELELHSASLIASQIIVDMECLYGRTISSGIGTPKSAEADHITSLLNGVKKGELLVVAVPDDKLREAFCLRVVQHVALQLRQSVAFCCMQESFSAFFRKLLNVEAGISSEENIYDGGLNEVAFLRLSAALVALKKASIRANQTASISLGHIGVLAKTHYEKTNEDGLILVDYIQGITDSNHCQVNPQAAIAQLKNWARELMVPMIVLHKLYPAPDIDNNAPTSAQDDLKWQIPTFLRNSKEYSGNSRVVHFDGYLKQVISDADTFLHLSGMPERLVLVRTTVL